MSIPVQNQLGLYVKKSSRFCQRLCGETVKIKPQKEGGALLDSALGLDSTWARMSQEGTSTRFLPVLACIWETLGYNISFPERVLKKGARL